MIISREKRCLKNLFGLWKREFILDGEDNINFMCNDKHFITIDTHNITIKNFKFYACSKELFDTFIMLHHRECLGKSIKLEDVVKDT